MRIERAIDSQIQTIQGTCGDCQNRNSCDFGKPALEVAAASASSSTDQIGRANAISYIWVEKGAKVSGRCPNPDEIDTTVANLVQIANG